MSEQAESIQLWAWAHIVSSLSWPISYVTISSLAALIDLTEPSLPILWLLGFIMGGITALASGLVVRRQISNSWKWVIANLIGTPLALTAAYLIFPFVKSPSGFAAVGFCSGLITSAVQSLAFKRQHNRIIQLMTGALGWALAFLFGYLLMVQRSIEIFVFMPNDFFSALLLGWGVSGSFLLILFIGLSPLPRERVPSGPGIWSKQR